MKVDTIKWEKFCEIMSKQLIEIYGKEGAIPYLKILLNPVEEKVI
jgi:hypothetical protein